MATFTQTLVSIIGQLEQARAAGDALAVADLTRRWDAICAALVALGQS